MNITRRYKLSLINNTPLTEKEYEIVNDVQELILGLDDFIKNQKEGVEGRMVNYMIPSIEKLKLKHKDDISFEDLNAFIIYMLDNTIKYLKREIDKEE